jgi:aerotaxis receptor
MRINEPVTNQEKSYHESQKIVSTTDLKGVIQDVNNDFIEISGFTKDELIGQAHNLVRHPSMPQEAFAELWQHNKAQKPWMGMVKNRCKNGDHYWVSAFVTPVFENGNAIGFQSVRQKPEQDLVDRAESIYQNKVGLINRFFFALQSVPLTYKLFICFSFVSLIAATVFFLSESLIAMWATFIIGNFAASMTFGNPWVKFSKETEKIFGSKLARKVYSGRADELGQMQTMLRFFQSQQDTILYRSYGVAETVKEAANSAHEVVIETTKAIDTLCQEVDMAATATNEMSATIQEVASNSASTSSSAEESKQNVAEGRTILTSTKKAIDDLVVAVDQSSEIIENLSQNSSKIGTVVDVISGIAEQTNLLALNAAIEAARAGEQGRGFAVVADEVRALAAKTQESTGQISEMISTLQQGASDAVNSISASHEKVNMSVENIHNLDNQFGTILENVDTISDMCIQIATATEEQSAVAEEINRNINKINDVGQSTLDTTEVMTSNNEKLIQASQSMSDMIKQFIAKAS